MSLPRALCRALAPCEEPVYSLSPAQLGMGRCPWRVAVCSQMLCRTRRAQMLGPLRQLLEEYPTPGDVCRATDLESILQPLGLQRNRARQLQRMSCLWLSECWEELSELPGCGKYVCDAVGLFCFGCTDLESEDAPLRKYAALGPFHRVERRGPLWVALDPAGTELVSSCDPNMVARAVNAAVLRASIQDLHVRSAEAPHAGRDAD